MTPWTVARQAPLSTGFAGWEYLSGVPFSSPGDLPNSRIESASPALQEDSLLTELLGKPSTSILCCFSFLQNLLLKLILEFSYNTNILMRWGWWLSSILDTVFSSRSCMQWPNIISADMESVIVLPSSFFIIMIFESHLSKLHHINKCSNLLRWVPWFFSWIKFCCTFEVWFS